MRSRDLAPGVAFGGYVVRELIGRGGMAAVYRAEHQLLEKPVALKVMDHALLSSASARQRFLLEGRVAAAIKHPNVVDITDVGIHEGAPYLVMELLEGDDLETYLRKRTMLDDRSVIQLALPVIAALHAAHASGVVHRDVKPSNIFMSIGPDAQLVPKVLDFGISKAPLGQSRLDGRVELSATPQYQIIGTPRYLPPEALRGSGELGPLSDQYSLGVVLYQCVTGNTPFGGDSLVALLESLSRGVFAAPRALRPSVSVGLDRVITRALSPEPSDRFPTLRDMGRALLELAAERTQLVWGQSFRGSPAGEATAPPIVLRGGARLSSSDRRLPITEQLSTGSLRTPRRWPALGRGVAVLLFGVVAAALWLSLAPLARHTSPLGELARGQAGAGAAPSPATRPPEHPSAPELALRASVAERAVLALGASQPGPHVSRPASTAPEAPRATPQFSKPPLAPALVRAPRKPARPPAFATTPPSDREAERRSSPPRPVETPVRPPPDTPRFGANRSPLLD